MAEATLQKPAGVVDEISSATVASGEIIQLSDGRAGILQGLQGVVSGDQAAYATDGIFKIASASATTFAVGDPVFFDASANLAVAPASTLDGAADFYLGVAVAAKIATQLTVTVDLNAVPLFRPFTYIFDCEDAVDAAVHTLIPASMNKSGLLITGCYGVVTEAFAGASEDQGIVTIKDTESSPNTLSTLTASDSTGDSVGDVIVGINPVFGATTGGAVKTVAAGKGVTGTVTQATSGSGATGKMRVYITAIPMV